MKDRGMDPCTDDRQEFQRISATSVADSSEEDRPVCSSCSDVKHPQVLAAFRSWAMPMACFCGTLVALLIVLAWFPRDSAVWTHPIHAIDAPSHYYFVRKLLNDGLSAAMRLNPNDGFYPPLFHLIVYGLIQLSGSLGIQMGLFAAVNLVWIVTSGLVFPIGMLLWCSCFFKDLRIRYKAILALLIPGLSVSSAAHPYWLFNAGPLFSYGLAMSLLPFLLYAGWQLIDAARTVSNRSLHNITYWLVMNLMLWLVVLLAHPRIAFTYLVLMGFFILFKSNWQLVLSMLCVVGFAGIAFYWYVSHRDHGKNFSQPSTWFHTFRPTRSIGESLCIVITNYLPGVSGWVMSLCVALAVIAALLWSGDRLKDGLALVCSYVLTGVIFVCSAALSGPLANIITAAWYRGETRPLTMIPLATIPLLVFGCRCLLLSIDSHGPRLIVQAVNSHNHRIGIEPSSNKLHKIQGFIGLLRTVTCSMLVLLLILANMSNDVKVLQADVARSNADWQTAWNEQLTYDKYVVLTRVRAAVGTRGVIIADPLNGSMYGMTLYGLNMLYPVYNPMDTKNGKVFADVERAFASGDDKQLLETVCPVDPSYTSHSHQSARSDPKYFLDLGPQAPSLQMFTYRAQYNPFHNKRLINDYIHSGAMHKVQEYAAPPDAHDDWALYRFACH